MAVTNSGMTLYTDNDSQESWSGSDDIDTEVFKQGTASESWLVGKNGDETSTMTKSQNFGATAKYFTFYMKSDWGAFYQFINATLNDGTVNNLFQAATGGKFSTPNPNPEISGDFKPSVLQMDQGTAPAYDPTTHTGITINVNASTSGNIRSITNHWIDCMYAGTGRTIGGTTTSDSLFTESADLDISSDTFDGLSTIKSGVIFFQSDVLVTTTSGNSYGETAVFALGKNTDNIYTLEITGTADFQSSSYSGESGVTLHLDTSAATSWQMIGGSLVGLGTTLFKLGQDIEGVVFTNRTSITHNGSNFENNIINTSGTVTVLSTGTFFNNTLNKATSTAVSTASLNDLDKNIFISSGTGHAVELTGSAATYSWDNVTTGYDTGTSGNGVQVTGGSITGDETIHITATTGTFIINVVDGATTPSVSSAGAIVNVVAGQRTFTFTVNPSITDYEWRIYSVTALGSLDGSVALAGSETATTDSKSYSYSYTVDTPIAVQILSQPDHDYIEEVEYYTLIDSDQDVTINLEIDNNN